MRLTSRTTAARWLLTVLLVGGVLAPIVHGLRHAHERAHQHAEVQYAAQALRAQGELVPVQWLVGEHFEEGDCTLCAAVWTGVTLPGGLRSSYMPVRPALSLDGTSRLAAEPFNAFLVRGPPSKA